MQTRRLIVMIAFDGAQSLDLTGPLEVFRAVSRLLAHQTGATEAGYDVRILAPGGRPFRCSSGVAIVPDGSLDNLPDSLDTMLVVGGEGSRTAQRDAEVIGAVRTLAGRARRVVSVCTGAFVLAAAGLLDGRRATTHWFSCEALARSYPSIAVDADPIYVRDGNVWTSAGVTAGMDLALALVEQDMGREIAATVARWLVVFVRRAGGQSQFSPQLAAELAERPSVRAVQSYVLAHPSADLSVPLLARRAAMSPRNFARVFRREVGLPPGAYVERVRVDAARRLLETTAVGVAEVAAAAGFGTAESLRRAMARRLGLSPSEYRRRFSADDVGVKTRSEQP